MSELDDLYQEVILDHGRSPRNFGTLPGANRHAEGYNPLCGDHFTVHLHVDGDRVVGAAFEGAGCAISTASASLMTEALRGMPVADAERLFHEVHALVTEGTAGDHLGKLEVFHGVRNFPLRVKCATLAWHTMKAALTGTDDVVTTE